MNVPFSGSRTAGFRCERRAGLSLLLLLPLLVLLYVWLLRRRPGQAALGVIILYYLAIHCLMAVVYSRFW